MSLGLPYTAMNNGRAEWLLKRDKNSERRKAQLATKPKGHLPTKVKTINRNMLLFYYYYAN